MSTFGETPGYHIPEGRATEPVGAFTYSWQETIDAETNLPEFLRLETFMNYDPADPAFVRFQFKDNNENPVWEVGRELLAEGTLKPTGEFDVQVTPIDDCGNSCEGETDWIRLALRGPAGAASLWLRRAELSGFLDATYRSVSREAADGAIEESLKQGFQKLIDESDLPDSMFPELPYDTPSPGFTIPKIIISAREGRGNASDRNFGADPSTDS